MTDKVIHEFRITETDDGYRIDITGDKDMLRKMGVPFGLMRGFGRRRRHGRHYDPRGHRRRHCRPGGHRHAHEQRSEQGYNLGPWFNDEPASPETPPTDG